MAVGDFVKIRPLDRGSYVERLIGRLNANVAAETLVSSRLFVAPSEPEGLWRWLPRSFAALTVGLLACILATGALRLLGWSWVWCGSIGVIAGILVAIAWTFVGGILDSRPRSLISIMETHHDVGLQPTAGGIETIGIPFPHVIMLTGKERHEYRAALESHATAVFEKRWRNYVDPLVGLRVRMLISRRVPEDELVAFFGTGIFAPRLGEALVGRVGVLMPGVHELAEPRLPDGTPAGLYRGQSTLAFSASISLTPATVDALAGVPGRFCLRANADTAAVCPYALDWDPAPGDGATFKPSREPIEPSTGVDAAFQVSFPETSFQVHVIDDDQLSRLLHAPPSDVELAIVGILEPVVDGKAPDRWWIDLDRHGRLVASAMRSPQRSIVCRGGVLSVWDWSTPGAAVRYPAKLETIKVPEGTRNVLAMPPGRPYGWLEPPEQSVAGTYVLGHGTSFELDWLDFAGAVEETISRSERLGAWMQRNGHGCVIPGIKRGPGDEALLVRAPDQSDFRPGWRGEWRPGMRILCEPFVLEVVGGRTQ